MDGYGKRLLLAAGMFALAALCASLPTKQTAGQTPPQTVVSAAPLTAKLPEQTEPATTETTEPAGFYVVLRAEAGRQASLLDETGALLQTVRANERGDATFEAVQPGNYRVDSQGVTGEFRLWENASVTATGGMLWSDGELLHLSLTPTVHLRLRFGVLAGQSDEVVTVRLTARDGTDYYRSLVSGSSGIYTVEFSCLPPGDYRVRIGGGSPWNITLTDEPEQEIKLGIP